MFVPTLKIDERFDIVLITKSNYDQAYDCFLESYKAHPYFKAVGANKTDLDFEFR